MVDNKPQQYELHEIAWVQNKKILNTKTRAPRLELGTWSLKLHALPLNYALLILLVSYKI